MKAAVVAMAMSLAACGAGHGDDVPALEPDAELAAFAAAPPPWDGAVVYTAGFMLRTQLKRAVEADLGEDLATIHLREDGGFELVLPPADPPRGPAEQAVLVEQLSQLAYVTRAYPMRAE